MWITTSWPAQPWYSQVLELTVTKPLLLPQLSNILVNPQGQAHPLAVNKTLRLVCLESFRQSLTSKEISERDAELITGTR